MHALIMMFQRLFFAKTDIKNRFFQVRMSVLFLYAPPSHLCTSYDHRFFGHIGALDTKMLNFVLIFVSEIVKPKTVSLLIHQFAQLGLKHPTLSRVQHTFKHRILHSLSVILTFLCNFSESSASGSLLMILFYPANRKLSRCVKRVFLLQSGFRQGHKT